MTYRVNKLKLFKIIKKFSISCCAYVLLALAICCTGVGTEAIVDADIPTLHTQSHHLDGHQAEQKQEEENDDEGSAVDEEIDVTANSDETAGRQTADAIQREGPGDSIAANPCWGPKGENPCLETLENGSVVRIQ